MEFNIEEKLNQLGETIDSKLELSKKDLGEEFKKVYKGEVDALAKEYNDRTAAMQKQLDEMDIAYQKKSIVNGTKSFGAALNDELLNSKSFKAFTSGESNKASLRMKAVLSTTANASGEVIPADGIPGIKYDPTRMTRVRDLLARGTTTSDTIRYVKENSFTNAAAMRVEASAYGSSEFILTYSDAPVRSLGSTITLTKEMLGDVPQLNSYISARLPQKVLNVEDTQLLFGAGTGVNLQGLMTSGGGTVFNETSTGAFYQFFGADQSANVNEYDVIVAAINQATLLEYAPTAIFVNPTDYHKMILRKATDSQYVVELQSMGTIAGVPIIKNTAVTADKFIVGDFQYGAQMFLRDDLTIEFSDQNSDNFEKDLITVKASERIALPIYRPNAFVWGDFSDAFAAISV
jgi:HK97 family phage major capsid protein